MLRVAIALSLLAAGSCLVVNKKEGLDGQGVHIIMGNQVREYDHWMTLKTYKAKPVCASNRQQFHKKDATGTGLMNLIKAKRQCAAMGSQFPTLVSHDPAALTAYEQHICSVHHHTTKSPHAIADVQMKVTTLKAGCFHGSTSGDKVAFNDTHVVFIAKEGRTRKDSQLAAQQVKALEEEMTIANQTDLQTTHADLIVVPGEQADIAYHKVLMDFLPKVYSTFKFATQNNAKILVRTKMQEKMLQNLGVPAHHMFLRMSKKNDMVCVGQDFKLHVLKTESPGAARQLNHRIGRQMKETVIANAIRELRKFGFFLQKQGSRTHDRRVDLAEQIKSLNSTTPAVVFAKRCGAREQEAEAQAEELIQSVMKDLGRTEEFVSFCGDQKTFAQVASLMGRAKLVIGSGGSLSSLLFTKPSCSTHVIEFVSDGGVKGMKPYDTYYNGGVGSPFSYKMVLVKPKNLKNMDKDELKEKDPEQESKKIEIHIEDLDLALKNVWVDATSTQEM